MKYEATVDGKIFRNGKECTQFLHHTGYSCVSIRNRQWRVHKFIWVFFHGDVPPGYCINHKDGNKVNNCLDNLECVTHQENTRHAYRTGLMAGKPGERNSRAKLSNEEAWAVFGMFETHSNSDIAKMFNLHPQYVSLIRHKRRWKELWKQYEGSETIPEGSRG